MPRECTEERFLKDVSEHQMTVLRDEGVNRHLRFRKPGTGCMGFDILTWPGYLCFTGDMGTYVFRRLEDMLEFFRTDARYAKGDGLKINPGYWGEKLEAIDRHGGFREWSDELFEEAVRRDVETFTDGWDAEQKAELVLAVENDVLHAGDQHDCIEAVRNFDHEGAEDLFADFWEHRLEDFTFRFMWCCYALAWTVKTYDAAPGVKGRQIDGAQPLPDLILQLHRDGLAPNEIAATLVRLGRDSEADAAGISIRAVIEESADGVLGTFNDQQGGNDGR